MSNCEQSFLERGDGWLSLPYVLPLLSSVVSTHVIVQAIKAVGMEAGQGCCGPGRGF